MIIEIRDIAQRVVDEQRKDQELILLREALETNNRFAVPKFGPSFRSLKLIEGAIYQVKKNGTRVVVVPDGQKKAVLEQIHNSGFAGHFGMNKTYATLKNKYFWPNMFNDLKGYIESCANCARWKKPSKNQAVQLQPVDYENRIGHQISIDFKGPLPTTEVTDLYPVKQRFVLMIVDNASKYIMAIPTANMTSEVTAEAIITKWVPLFGVCDTIICDNGPGFKSKLFQNICDRLQISMNNSTPYNPRSNGLVEVNNKLIGTMLFSMVQDKVNKWNQFLDFVISAYNSSIHSTTNFTPNFLVFGRELIQPVDVVFGFDIKARETKGWEGWDAHMKERVHARDKALYQAYQLNRSKQEKNRSKVEPTSLAKPLSPGDRCAVSIPRKKKKHIPPWDTDYEVVDLVTPSTYLIRNINTGQTMTLNRRFLKLVIDRNDCSSSHSQTLPPLPTASKDSRDDSEEKGDDSREQSDTELEGGQKEEDNASVTPEDGGEKDKSKTQTKEQSGQKKSKTPKTNAKRGKKRRGKTQDHLGDSSTTINTDGGRI